MRQLILNEVMRVSAKVLAGVKRVFARLLVNLTLSVLSIL